MTFRDEDRSIRNDYIGNDFPQINQIRNEYSLHQETPHMRIPRPCEPCSRSPRHGPSPSSETSYQRLVSTQLFHRVYHLIDALTEERSTTIDVTPDEVETLHGDGLLVLQSTLHDYRVISQINIVERGVQISPDVVEEAHELRLVLMCNNGTNTLEVTL